MIYFIQGTVESILQETPSPGLAKVIINNNNIGYDIIISTKAISTISEIAEEARIYTYYYHKEDAVELYGFLMPIEKEVFIDLISVSGIGCRLAMKMFSYLTTDEIISSVISSDITNLSRVSGLGKKSAEKICVQLKDRLAKKYKDKILEKTDSTFKMDLFETAVEALITLDYGEAEARNVVKKIINKNKDLSLEEIIKEALKQLVSR